MRKKIELKTIKNEKLIWIKVCIHEFKGWIFYQLVNKKRRFKYIKNVHIISEGRDFLWKKIDLK